MQYGIGSHEWTWTTFTYLWTGSREPHFDKYGNEYGVIIKAYYLNSVYHPKAVGVCYTDVILINDWLNNDQENIGSREPFLYWKWDR